MNDINNVEGLSTSQIRDLVNQGGKFVIYTYCISLVVVTLDPHLVEVTDSGEGNANDIVLYTTSRPTRHYNLENSGQYRYSAYSNRNIMWTKYIFDTNNGSFRVYGRFNKKPFNIIFHNCSNNRDYKYAITSDSEFDYYQFEVMDGTAPRSFYFGIDTKSTRSAVSVNGFVDTY